METQTSNILDSYKKKKKQTNSEPSFTFLPKNRKDFSKMGLKRDNAFFTKQYASSKFFFYRY